MIVKCLSKLHRWTVSRSLSRPLPACHVQRGPTFSKYGKVFRRPSAEVTRRPLYLIAKLVSKELYGLLSFNTRHCTYGQSPGLEYHTPLDSCYGWFRTEVILSSVEIWSTICTGQLKFGVNPRNTSLPRSAELAIGASERRRFLTLKGRKNSILRSTTIFSSAFYMQVNIIYSSTLRINTFLSLSLPRPK